MIHATPATPAHRSSENRAARLVRHGAPLEVGDAPYPDSVDADQIVVRAHAVAINPIDWIIAAAGRAMYSWLTLPIVLGHDVAGEVVAVGSAITRFSVGDRVAGLAVGADKDINSSAQGAFQEHVILSGHLTTAIPAETTVEAAAVLPLGASTAACGLFQSAHLDLQRPSDHASPTGRTVLVWGGSASIGSNAVQLAVAAGYDVIATASPRNFDYVRGLGAGGVFDYNSATVVADIVAAAQGRRLDGAIAIGQGSASACIDVIGATNSRKIVAMASTAASLEPLTRTRPTMPRLAATMAALGARTAALKLKSIRAGVKTSFIWGTSLKNDDVSTAIFRDFLPDALRSGAFVPAPPPQVVGHGLEQIEAGLRTQIAGVSAAKVVVTL